MEKAGKVWRYFVVVVVVNTGLGSCYWHLLVSAQQRTGQPPYKQTYPAQNVGSAPREKSGHMVRAVFVFVIKNNNFVIIII